ncbi:MAG: fibronectin type III domain-containing protein [Thermoguttaceae bacterium]
MPSSRPDRHNSRLRRASFEQLEERALLSINVTLYRYDAASSGLDASETVLTPANVYAGSFGKQFTTAVDGQVLAQPLYMSGLTITIGPYAGTTHNVVFVATEHDSLYAIDADSGQVLWQDSFLISTSGVTSGVTVTTVPSADVDSGDISPEIGITDTPAIDASTGYLYVVAKTKDVYNGDTADPHAVNTLYKVNIQNGTYTYAVIADTTYSSNGSYDYTGQYNSGPYVLGTGDGYITVSGQNRVYFNSLRQTFRPAVALLNGQVVLGSASHGDNGPYHGWMLTYNETTLALTGVLNTTPNGGLGGIWQGGDPIVSDPQGYFYFQTGNGSFDTSLNSQGFPSNGDYGDSFVKVAVDPTTSQTNQNVNGWGLKVVDYFTPYNQASLSAGDVDLGSGGPTILPDSAGSAAHPYLLVGGGKQGSIYLIDRDNMGKYSPTTDNVVQELANTVGGILSTPAYFNGNIYITSGYSGPIDEFSISNAQLTADGATPDNFGNLDGSPTISADGTANGIVWVLERGSGELRAYSAANLSDEIYNSSTLPNNADAPGTIMKFTVPMVANGDVYVGTGNSLVMYGLNAPPTTPPAAPSNLAITGYSGSEVSLSWTNNANNESAFDIERSTDGTTFTQIGTAGVDETSYVDTSVQPFTTYYYRVRASNIIGYSTYTNVVTVETLGQPAVGGGDGLLGQYYAGTNSFDSSPTPPTSPPTLTRVDPEINFNWNTTGPATNVGQTNFEVQWTGEVQAQYSEDYTFYTTSDDGVELFIDGQPVIDDLNYQSPTLETSSPIELQAGKSYAVEILYFQGGGGAEMYLSWSSPHTPTEIIPQSQLFSGSAPAAPSNLQAAAISGTQTELTWTTNSTDEDGYEVDRMLGSSGTFSPVAFLPPGSSQYLDTGLTAGNTYTYEVRATNFVADSAWSNQAVVTLPVLPDAVTDAMATTVTTNSISMTWTPEDDNGTVFRIFRLVGPGGNPIFIASLPDDPSDPITNYTDTGPGGLGLSPGLLYTYHVQVGNLAGFSAYSQFSVQTLTNAPDQLLAVPANAQVTLSWDAPVGAGTFNVYRGTTPGGESATPLATGVTGTIFVDTSVTNDAEYYYQVTAVDTGGESARSAECSALPLIPTTLAPPPTKVSATPGDGTVLLAWQATTGASSYNVYRSTASGGEVLVASGVSSPSYSDTGLTDGLTYYYQVTSVNQVGESTRSGEVSAVPQMIVPSTPINVTAAPGNNQVALSWSAASDALTYNIYRSTDTGNEVLYEQDITGTSYIDANVTNGVTYYYQVSAGNGVGESNLSQEVSATPLPALPVAPASLTATALSSSQIRLTWSESPGTATSFTLERSTDGVNFTPLTTLDGTATSFVDASGLSPAITYSYRLSATNLAGSSAWSNVATAEPLMEVSSPWTDVDIGSPTLAGSAYDSNGTVIVNGSGNDIWNASDQFHFVYVPFTGNGTIIAQVVSQGYTDPWAKAGVMFRDSLAANSAFADMVLTPGNGVAFQSRDTSGNLANANTGGGGYTAPVWVELVRSGSTFTGYVSSDGINWTEPSGFSPVTLTMNSTIYVGLCVTSHDASAVSTATFNQISINGSTTPTAPSGLTASAASGTSVALVWTNNDSYSFANEVYRQDPGSPTFSWIATVPSNATSFLDTGLTPGDSYSYQVLASNTVGNSASNTATATTPVPPLAISALQPGSIGTTSALLSWVLNSSNDTGVQILRRMGGAGNFSLVATLPAGSTDFTDNTLQPGTLYEYHVSAVDLAGSSPAADTGLTTLPLAPVATAAIQAGQVQLSWTASNGAVAYNIYRGLTSGGEGASPYATVNNATQFTDAGVIGGQTYYYLITAVDFSGESVPSAEVAAAVPVVTEQALWSSAVDGSWSTYGSWEDPVSGATVAAPGLRGVAGDTVLFSSATGSTVTLDGASPSVAAITFGNSNISYTISQGTGGVLHLDNGGSSARITVSSGSHTIDAPVSLDSSVTVLPASGSQLTISGGITGAGALTVDNQGTVVLSGANDYIGGTTVSTGTLILANSTAIAANTSLTVGAGASMMFASSADATPSSVATTATPVIAGPPDTTVASNGTSTTTSSAARATDAAGVTSSEAASSLVLSALPAVAAVRNRPVGSSSQSPIVPLLVLQPSQSGPAGAMITPVAERLVASSTGERIAGDLVWLGQVTSSSDNSNQQRKKDVAILALETVFAQYSQ